VDARELHRLMDILLVERRPAAPLMAYLEPVWGRPGCGVAGISSICISYGILVALYVPATLGTSYPATRWTSQQAQAGQRDACQ